MAYSISLTKRTNGGYTIVTEDYTCYPSVLTYHGIDGGVILFSRGLNLLRFYRPSEWTIQSATGYTTVVQVCDALDALGISATEGTDDIEALLTTIDADTGSILTAVQLMDDDLDDARLALQVMDDWDESDRAKVNLIASQAGIDGNSGAVTAKTPRVTLASDDPAVVSLGNIDNAVDGSYLNVNINAAGTDVATNSGTLNDQTLRVAIATDDVNAVKIVNATELMDDWDESGRAKVNPIVGQTGVEAGAGKPTLKTQRTLQAKPDYVDITSDAVIYEGYSNGTNYDICKIDLSTAVITREWATGDWEDRASLFVE